MTTSVELHILDKDNVQDPQVLLDVLSELLAHERQLESAMAMLTAVLLHHLGELDAPKDPVHINKTIGMLKTFLSIAAENTHNAVLADQMQDLLESEE